MTAAATMMVAAAAARATAMRKQRLLLPVHYPPEPAGDRPGEDKWRKQRRKVTVHRVEIGAS